MLEPALITEATPPVTHSLGSEPWRQQGAPLRLAIRAERLEDLELRSQAIVNQLGTETKGWP